MSHAAGAPFRPLDVVRFYARWYAPRGQAAELEREVLLQCRRRGVLIERGALLRGIARERAAALQGSAH